MTTASGVYQPLSAILKSAEAFPPDPEGQLDTITPRLIYCVINALGLAFACYRLNGMGLFPTHLTDWAGTIEAPRVPEVATQGLWSLVSYEDVQHYFDRKVLQEGKHASHQLASVMSAKRHFEEVSGLPILRPGDDVLIGVVSRKDLDKKPDAESVGDVMSAPPLALKKSDTVEHAAAVMLKHKVHRVPIVDDNKLVIGMVTRTDLFRALSAGEHSW
ncbi:hypothetical protein QBZ16_004980 [Prototheca wickerhamii]|uniref:ER membrane protein complex subunit 4 n=1 Tax=Prototheca wickerhamii TaxID=3111 RepID=A0AAD9IFB1_PROWI|nr:hypothetical protein QBZ16_004980 [Prototheca wickerhamii]